MLRTRKPERNYLAMDKKAVLNLLGIAMRAGKLVTGEDLVIKSIQKAQAEFIFVAKDASENTRKKLIDKSSFYKVPVDVSFSQIELSSAIGRKRMVISVADKGFARKFDELIKG